MTRKYDGFMETGLSIVGLDVQGSSMGNQRLDNRYVAILSGEVNGSQSVIITLIENPSDLYNKK